MCSFIDVLSASAIDDASLYIVNCIMYITPYTYMYYIYYIPTFMKVQEKDRIVRYTTHTYTDTETIKVHPTLHYMHNNEEENNGDKMHRHFKTFGGKVDLLCNWKILIVRHHKTSTL